MTEVVSPAAKDQAAGSAPEGHPATGRAAPQPDSLGLVTARPRGGEVEPAFVIASGLTAVWLLLLLAFWLFVPSAFPPGIGAFGVLVAIILPVALIWVAAVAARSARVVSEESARLAAAVDAIRHAQATQSQSNSSGIRPPVEAKLDEIARAQRQAESVLAQLTQAGGVTGPAPPSSQALPAAAPRPRPAGEKTAEETHQPALALGTPPDALDEPLPNDEFIRALNFPEDERDAVGFRALRLALKDRFSAELVRSAQDVLTLLAEDGIYMDDLAPDRARPEVWRRFAQGERGRGIAPLGGVRDRSCLALTAGRMRQDPIFRDVAHHFLRKFDHTFAAFEPRASDADIVSLAETRTARAFMLVGRVAGTFD
ncbi:MAG: hypothetical protein AAFU80_12180 [Pseudomonadota bacterium]